MAPHEGDSSEVDSDPVLLESRPDPCFTRRR